MIALKNKQNKNTIIYIIPIIVALFNVLIIMFPSQITTASKNGLLLWFNNVIPSLLPFIIGANLLTGLGFVNFLGTLLASVMYKVFNISGSGAFALVMGMTSGYPMGAKITASLYETGEINETEAQRLISFTNNSGPLFILGTVSASMFGSSELGILILSAHYLAAITIGILFRYYKKSDTPNYIPQNKSLLKKALQSLKNERIKDGRPFGKVLSDSIKDSMETLLVIGGFIILFSVISEALKITGIFSFFNRVSSPIADYLNLDKNLISPVITGILEITNGCKALAYGSLTPAKIAAAAGIISWGGFSIHAQAISFLSKTKIKISLYFLSKILHSIISVIYVLLLYPLFNIQENSVEVFSQTPAETLISSSQNFLIITLLLLIISVLPQLVKKKVK